MSLGDIHLTLQEVLALVRKSNETFDEVRPPLESTLNQSDTLVQNSQVALRKFENLENSLRTIEVVALLAFSLMAVYFGSLLLFSTWRYLQRKNKKNKKKSGLAD